MRRAGVDTFLCLVTGTAFRILDSVNHSRLFFLAGEVGYTIKITQHQGHWQLFIGGHGHDVLAGLSHTEG